MMGHNNVLHFHCFFVVGGSYSLPKYVKQANANTKICCVGSKQNAIAKASALVSQRHKPIAKIKLKFNIGKRLMNN